MKFKKSYFSSPCIFLPHSFKFKIVLKLCYKLKLQLIFCFNKVFRQYLSCFRCNIFTFIHRVENDETYKLSYLDVNVFSHSNHNV